MSGTSTALVVKTSFCLFLPSHYCLSWLQNYLEYHKAYNFSRLGFHCLSYSENNKATEKKVWTTTLLDVLLAYPYRVLMTLKNILKIRYNPPFLLHTRLNWQCFSREVAALCRMRSGTSLYGHKTRPGLQMKKKETRAMTLKQGLEQRAAQAEADTETA